MPCDLDQPINRLPDAFFTIVDDELIIMDNENETFFSSRTVGTMIWQRLEMATTIDALTDAVAARYPSVARETIASDVRDFVGELDKLGLIAPG